MAKRYTYDWSHFTEKIEIKASPEKVYRAWTDDKLITKWFVHKAVIEPKKGGRFYMKFLGDVESDEKVLGIRKNSYFCFSFGKAGETVEITIKKSGKGTDCILRQFGMKTSNKAKVQWHMGCRNGWVFFLTNLKSFLEKGVDLRSHDPRKSYKQGYVNS
jgi:uncharacterized protein YndB with AHSA1/START domain